MVELGMGDVARIAHKEEHWHGAAPDAAMTHIVVTGPGKTRWLEEVVETEYQPS
jgi:quercetin dioxygenase-like cupin family protein